jgi:hypothetical protein
MGEEKKVIKKKIVIMDGDEGAEETYLEGEGIENCHPCGGHDHPCRGNVVMTRLSDEDLKMIDALVNLEVFSSRSEAVAYFTHTGLEQKKDMTSKVMPFVEQIKKLKEEAKSALK